MYIIESADEFETMWDAFKGLNLFGNKTRGRVMERGDGGGKKEIIGVGFEL